MLSSAKFRDRDEIKFELRYKEHILKNKNNIKTDIANIRDGYGTTIGNRDVMTMMSNRS